LARTNTTIGAHQFKKSLRFIVSKSFWGVCGRLETSSDETSFVFQEGIRLFVVSEGKGKHFL